MKNRAYTIHLTLALLVAASACGPEDGPAVDCVTVVDQGKIEEPTTWGDECPTVEVMRALTVRAPLTVLKGTTVRSAQDVNIHISETGSLNAVGTQSAPIVFEGFEPDKGFWSGISIGSRDGENQLEYVTITDAGGEGWQFNPYILTVTGTSTTEGAVVMHHVTITNGSGTGLVLLTGGEIEGSTNLMIEDVDGDAISIAFSEIGQLHESFRAVDNGGPFTVTRGDLVTQAVVPSLAAPLIIQNQIRIRDGGHLSVQGGNEVRFEQDVLLATSSEGTMSFEGTEEDGIALVGKEATPGFWGGLVFETFSQDNKITYTTIADAGAKGWQGRKAGIVVTGDSTSKGMVTVEESAFIDIIGFGIEVLEGGELIESGNTFENVTQADIEDHNSSM